MRAGVILVVLLSGCGASGGGGDDDGDSTDGTGSVDAVSAADEDGGGTSSVAGDCVAKYTWRTESNTTDDFNETRVYVAEFDLADAQQVSARLCSWSSNGGQSNGYPPTFVCPAGNTCTGGYPEAPSCVIQEGGSIVDGKLQVYCGYEVESQNGSSGGHWASVEVTAN